MLTWKRLSYKDLTVDELYNILQLRSEIFVVEQNCIYQDIDFKDQKAVHILGYDDNKLVAYSRVFKPGDYLKEASIGRVLVKQGARKHGFGHDLIKESIATILEDFKTTTIHISAQTYLEKFYNFHGFIKNGEGYLEDGIPHMKMIKSSK